MEAIASASAGANDCQSQRLAMEQQQIELALAMSLQNLDEEHMQAALADSRIEHSSSNEASTLAAGGASAPSHPEAMDPMEAALAASRRTHAEGEARRARHHQASASSASESTADASIEAGAPSAPPPASGGPAGSGHGQS